jgi:hypothetical protein
MYLNAENVSVEGDEHGFTLEVFGYANTPDADEVTLTVNIQGIDLDAFYDQVKARIGPYLREMHAAQVAHGAQKRAEYDREVYDHERQTGQHAFVCSPEDVDESAGAYELSDPKHPRYHSTHADIWDARDGK